MRPYLLSLILLASCQTTSTSWQVTHLDAGNPLYDSARLSYPIHDIVNEVGVEMIYTQGQIKTYLEVHSHPIPPYRNHPKEARVALLIDGKTTSAIAKRHEGGQRLSLPPSLQQLLIESLQQDRTVKIMLDGYSITLNPEHFAKQYETLHSKPFKLPLKFYE